MLCSWLVPKKDASHWAGLLNPLVLASTHIFIPSYSFSVDSPAVFSSFLFHFVCQSINLFVGCRIQIDQILLWPVTQKWQSNCVNVWRKDFSVFGRCSCFLPAVWTFLNSILTTACLRPIILVYFSQNPWILWDIHLTKLRSSGYSIFKIWIPWLIFS